jgi:hypothetical protein
MRITSSFKGLGYLISTVSVVLLGIVAWQSASRDRLLLICLIAGMASSVLGMSLRWISHRVEQKEKDRIEAKADNGGSGRESGSPSATSHAA